MICSANHTFQLKLEIPSYSKNDFIRWQSKFRASVAKAKGFSNLEILAPFSSQNCMWFLNLRFDSPETLKLWLKSPTNKKLVDELTNLSIDYDNQSSDSDEKFIVEANPVTEVYLTRVDKKKLPQFHAWHEKIHQIETTFPGFQKVYIQAPNQEDKNGVWITLLQFDTLSNLENWLQSSQRIEILKESKHFMTSKQTHRVLSSFGNWFRDPSSLHVSSVWKQTMIILAVLYPLVMMQSIFLSPYLSSFDSSIKTFIENVICVILLAWPMLPCAIYALKWWLDESFSLTKNLLGIGILLIVYATEVLLFSLK